MAFRQKLYLKNTKMQNSALYWYNCESNITSSSIQSQGQDHIVQQSLRAFGLSNLYLIGKNLLFKKPAEILVSKKINREIKIYSLFAN